MGGSQGWGSTVGQRNGRRPAASFGGGDVVEEDEEGQGGRRLGFPHVTRERMAQGTSLFLAFPCFCHVASKLGEKKLLVEPFLLPIHTRYNICILSEKRF
jgi:hypothetical protein